MLSNGGVCLLLEKICSKRPLNIVNGIEVDFHEGADIKIAVFPEIILIAHSFVIRFVVLGQHR